MNRTYPAFRLTAPGPTPRRQAPPDKTDDRHLRTACGYTRSPEGIR
jgi:hypothetical protein